MNALAFDEVIIRNGKRIPHPCAIAMDEANNDLGLATDRFPHQDDLMTHSELVALSRHEARKHLPPYAFDQLFNSKGKDVAFKPHIRPGGRRARDEDPDDNFDAVVEEVKSWSSDDRQRLLETLSDAAQDDVDPRYEDRDTSAARNGAHDRKRVPAMDSAPRSSWFDRAFPETKGIRSIGSGVDRQYR